MKAETPLKLFARIFKFVKWKLTCKVTTAPCVQEKGLSHGTGFPLELVSIVPHFGTSSHWTRKTATLVKENSLSVGHRPWTHHCLYQSVHLLFHPSIHPSSIFSSTYPSFHSGIHSVSAPQDPTLIHARLHPSTHPGIHWEFSRMKSWGSRGGPVQFRSVLFLSCPSYSWEEGSPQPWIYISALF